MTRQLWTLLAMGMVCLATHGSLLAADQPAAADKLEFKTFASAEGRFKIDFPGAPVESNDETDTPIGKVTYHLLVVEPKKSGESYSVAYSDIGEKSVPNFNFEKALDNSRDRLVKSLDAKLTKEDKVTVAGLPARELTIEKPQEKTIYRWRLLYQKGRQYQIIVAATGHPLGDDRVKQYFDSFKLREAN